MKDMCMLAIKGVESMDPAASISMPEQDPKERITNFREVEQGLSEEQVLQEVSRCLVCRNPLCVNGCPVTIDIPAFIQLIKEKRYLEAATKIKESNFLPAVCGRVCPQEKQCEKACILSKKGEPITIGYLERFVADYAMKQEMRLPTIENNGRRVAVIGSGPSGLTCAGELRLLGYEVTVCEALHELGGVLVYGIPEFRLPKRIVEYEVEYLKKIGVRFHTNVVIGKTVDIDELLNEENYDAVYIASGAGFPSFMGIEGEDLNFVYSANEFLTRINLMKAHRFPEVDTPVSVGKRVAIVGGGNTAIDAARCARRLGPDKVFILYRRTRDEMPARAEEVRHAEEEGIEILFLTQPIAYVGDESGEVRKIIAQRMQLGEADERGRRRPVPIPESIFEIDIDAVIVAVGTQANPLIADSTPNLTLTPRGYIQSDSDGRTSIEHVYAGGDIVTGSATVIEAMAAGKKIAHVIDKDLKEKRA